MDIADGFSMEHFNKLIVRESFRKIPHNLPPKKSIYYGYLIHSRDHRTKFHLCVSTICFSCSLGNGPEVGNMYI